MPTSTTVPARRDLQFARSDVDRDHRPGPRQCGTLDGIEPDAPGADDHDTAAGLHARGVDDGAKAGDDGAGEQRGTVERNVVGNRNGLRRIDDDRLREPAHAHPLRNG